MTTLGFLPTSPIHSGSMLQPGCMRPMTHGKRWRLIFLALQELKERCEKARWLPPTYDFVPTTDGKGFFCRLSIEDAGARRSLQHGGPHLHLFMHTLGWLLRQFP